MNAPAIKALRDELDQIAKRIDALEMQPTFPITITAPNPRPGELFVGVVISADGTRREKLYLLPGDNDDADWQAQNDWAASIGGRLPDRVESALLFATMKDQFKPEAYWTREQHAADSSCAWYQYFDGGYQHYDGTHDKLRARAVRSEPIE